MSLVSISATFIDPVLFRLTLVSHQLFSQLCLALAAAEKSNHNDVAVKVKFFLNTY